MYSWHPTLSLSPCSTMSSHKIQSPSSRFILQIFSAVSMIWNSVSCKCIHSNHQTLSACWYYSPLQTNKTKISIKTHSQKNKCISQIRREYATTRAVHTLHLTLNLIQNDNLLLLHSLKKSHLAIIVHILAHS